MKTPEIPLDSIYVGKSFRTDYGDIDQLCYSISNNGLICPLAVAKASAVSDELKEGTSLPYVLLSGRRRLRALTKLGWKNVPVRIFDQPLSALEQRSIERADNFDRKSLAYIEEVGLLNEINSLQIAANKGDKT